MSKVKIEKVKDNIKVKGIIYEEYCPECKRTRGKWHKETCSKDNSISGQ